MAPTRYTTRQVARLLKLQEHQIRAYVRSGVITGGRTELCPLGRGTGQRLRFDFRDLAVLKTARKLLAAGLPAIRVQHALTVLKSQLPADEPLCAVGIAVEGGQIVVTRRDVRWEPESGQAHLALPQQAPPEPKPETPPPVRRTLAEILHAKKLRDSLMGPEAAHKGADDWFNLGIDLDEHDPDGAYESYLRALAHNPEHVEAMINIGRLCSESGDDNRAAAYFRQAIRVLPTQPVAHFNLAVTMHDLGDLEAAREEYSAALHNDPDFADAHFNLATLLEEIGDSSTAKQHMDAYQSVLQNHSN